MRSPQPPTSRDYAYVLNDLCDAYRKDLENVYSVIRKVSDTLRNNTESGSKIPYPNLTIFVGKDKADKVPPFRVNGHQKR